MAWSSADRCSEKRKKPMQVMMPDIDKVVVVTGASSGIGESTAKLLTRHGAKVVLGARRKDRLDAAVKEISAAGGKAISVAVDVTKRAEGEALIREAFDSFGRVDVMVNDAGIMAIAPIEALKAESKKFEYKIYQDAPGGHSFNRLDTRLARDSREEIYKFLARYLTPPGTAR